MLRPFSLRFAAALCVASLAAPMCLLPTARPAYADGDEWEAKTALVQSLRQSATRLQKSGDLSGAIAAYHQAIHADPVDPDTYADLGDVYFEKGQSADALRWYREATGTLPGQNWMASRMEEGDLFLRFASMLAQMGRYEESLDMYHKGRETLPNATRKLLPTKWQVKKLMTDPSEKKAFLTATRLAIGAWYASPELTQNDSTAGERASFAFRAAYALSPGDPTINLLVQNGVMPRGVASENRKSDGAVLAKMQ